MHRHRPRVVTSSLADSGPFFAHKGLFMQFDSTESIAARRSADRLARVLVVVALVAAALAVLPIAFHGRRADAGVALAQVALPGNIATDRPQSTGRGSTPSPFGYLEFDWEGGVPGFDPWLTEGYRP